MGIDKINSQVNIAVSGMRANALRMKVIANNIANASVTSPDGKPYCRKDVVMSSRNDEVTGVSVSDVVEDRKTGFRPVYDPSHPHANQDGYVIYSNVQVPKEMMNLMLASRQYQASIAIMKQHQSVSETAMELLR